MKPPEFPEFMDRIDNLARGFMLFAALVSALLLAAMVILALFSGLSGAVR